MQLNPFDYLGGTVVASATAVLEVLGSIPNVTNICFDVFYYIYLQNKYLDFHSTQALPRLS